MTHYYSSVDSSIPVDKDKWVVSIMRKPNGTNSEHAFLVVEGINPYGKAILRRYDLFIDNNNQRKALISIKPELIVEPDNAREALLKDILRGESIYEISWSISKEQAKALHQDILTDSKNPPNYQVYGDLALLPKSSEDNGHSCFTWAREKLHNLNDQEIQLPTRYSDFIAAKTSHYIRGSSDKSYYSYNKCSIM